MTNVCNYDSFSFDLPYKENLSKQIERKEDLKNHSCAHFSVIERRLRPDFDFQSSSNQAICFINYYSCFSTTFE